MFNKATRDNGSTFYRLNDDAPEWLTAAVRSAHASTMPNDWIFETCADAYAAIKAGDLADEDSLHEYADGQVEIYTQAIYQWGADMCLTNLYSQAEEEADDLLGGKKDATIEKQFQTIQFCAIRFIAQTILTAVQDNAE